MLGRVIAVGFMVTVNAVPSGVLAAALRSNPKLCVKKAEPFSMHCDVTVVGAAWAIPGVATVATAMPRNATAP